MASIFDDLRNKGSGLLGDLNNFLFSDTRTQEQKDASSYGFNEVSEGLQNVYQNESKTAFTPPVKPSVPKTNTLVPPPQDKGSNLFLGAVGDYYREAQKTWKDKGGFEALMSNPQFGIGLSLLQQASEGKTIGQAGLKAMVDGGIISSEYAKKIAARGKVTGPVTQAQIDQVKAIFSASGLGGEPSITQKFKDFYKGESWKAKQDMAAIEIVKEANERAQRLANQGKKPNIDDIQREVTKEFIANGTLQVGRTGFGISSEKSITLKSDKFREEILNPKKIPDKDKRELGGPVTRDKAYLVGEVGPEVFIPKTSGKIVSNDDSKIINLLLEANPHLKSVSPARAEKILRNRFPDYFE